MFLRHTARQEPQGQEEMNACSRSWQQVRIIKKNRSNLFKKKVNSILCDVLTLSCIHLFIILFNPATTSTLATSTNKNSSNSSCFVRPDAAAAASTDWMVQASLDPSTVRPLRVVRSSSTVVSPTRAGLGIQYSIAKK